MSDKGFILTQLADPALLEKRGHKLGERLQQVLDGTVVDEFTPPILAAVKDRGTGNAVTVPELGYALVPDEQDPTVRAFMEELDVSDPVELVNLPGVYVEPIVANAPDPSLHYTVDELDRMAGGVYPKALRFIPMSL